MAIGEDRREILKLIFRQSAILLITGLVLGATLSLAGPQATKSLLFNLAPNDPATTISAILALAGVTTLATWLPRAARPSSIR
jgi:ABC-type antimicrobial peptide transport system permease subunit